MIHHTFGENWLHREGASLRLPPVVKGPAIREIAMRGNPTFAHEWYVARDFTGVRLYEGTSEAEAREALMESAPERAALESRPQLLSQLVHRYGILAPGGFSVRLRADGVPVISEEGDSSDNCLLFWTGEERLLSSSEPATRSVRLGRRLMGGTFALARNFHHVAKRAENAALTTSINLAVMVLQPGQVLMLEGERGFEILLWDEGRLQHGRLD